MNENNFTQLKKTKHDLSKKNKYIKRKVASDTLRREIKSYKTWVFTFMTANCVRIIENMTIMALIDLHCKY